MITRSLLKKTLLLHKNHIISSIECLYMYEINKSYFLNDYLISQYLYHFATNHNVVFSATENICTALRVNETYTELLTMVETEPDKK